MKKMIHIDLVPNFEEDDKRIILDLIDREIFKDFKKFPKEEIWKAKKESEEILKSYFPFGDFYFFYSARSALTFVLNILNSFEKKEFVLTQAFTCLVVPNAIKFAGLRPIYLDIDESFNIDASDLKRKIKEIGAKNIQAIIIQNTFGIPAKIKEILEVAKENNILVIENLTHSLGAKYKNVYLGNFGDFALLSFNRNKVISSIIGGALVVNNKRFKELTQKEYGKLKERGIKKIILSAWWFLFLKDHYNFINKTISIFLRKLNLTLEMISNIEKQGKESKNYLSKFPELLFPLLLNQLKKLEKFNNHRKEIARVYFEKFPLNFHEELEPIFLRYPVLKENRDEILEKLKKEKILLGDWYLCPIYPCGDFKKFDYQEGCCREAERVSKKILNLPTNIDLKKEEAENLINLIS